MDCILYASRGTRMQSFQTPWWRKAKPQAQRSVPSSQQTYYLHLNRTHNSDHYNIMFSGLFRKKRDDSDSDSRPWVGSNLKEIVSADIVDIQKIEIFEKYILDLMLHRMYLNSSQTLLRVISLMLILLSREQSLRKKRTACLRATGSMGRF